MIIDKTCSWEYGFNETVCQNLHKNEYDPQEKLVSDNVAQFNSYETYIRYIIPALLACYVGAWTDIFGSKQFICGVLLGSTFQFIINMLSAVFMKWSKYLNLIGYGLFAISGNLKILL